MLLKGADTIVALAGRSGRRLRRSGLRRSPPPGTGDVLTGVVGAFLSKGLDAHDRGGRGSGRARACREPRRARTGLVAGDLLELLPAHAMRLAHDRRSQ